MSWDIPAIGAVKARYDAAFVIAFATDPDGNPYPETPDTSSPDSVFFVLGAVGEEVATDLYLYQRSRAEELMPDTAQDWLTRHADEWGVPRLQPQTALGRLILTGTVGAPLPSGIEVSDGTNKWMTVSTASIPAGGSVSIPAQAEAAGTAGNVAAGTALTLVSPVAGVTGTAAVVDAAGFVGGTDLEDQETWRARLLAAIRTPGAAGTAADYVGWAKAAGAAYVSVVSPIAGAGSVGVYIAMAGPRAPTGDELARIDAVLQLKRPVTADVVTIAATLLAVPVQLAMSPDTLVTRGAAQTALSAYLLREGRIGGVLPLSRINEAISGAVGEYAHRLDLPTADVAPAAGQLPVLGAVAFVDGSALPQDPGA